MKLFKTPSRIMAEEFEKTIGDLKLEKDGNKTMTITIYELLGLIKDEKAPKKILFNELEYEFDIETQTYIHKITECAFYDLMDECDDDLNEFLNDTVEILEEENKIEKLETCKIIKAKDILELEMSVNKRFADYTYKINQLIDEINKLKEDK